MTQSNPIVSIVVNCHNGENFLKKTLESVLSQTFRDWELIFWDNKSSDKSKEIFENFKDERFTYYKSKNFLKLYSARNEAIKICKGKFIAFLDSDDWWESDKIEEQLLEIKKNQLNVCVSPYFIYYQSIHKKKKQIVNSNKSFNLKNLLKNYNIAISSVIIEKKIFDNFSYFNENYNIIGDFDFIIKLSEKYKIGIIDKPSVNIRLHKTNYSKLNHKEEIDEIKKWIKNFIIKNSEINNNYLVSLKKRLKYLEILDLINNKKKITSFFEIIKFPLSFEKIKLLIKFFIPNIFYVKLIKIYYHYICIK